ncbi:MAG: GtrA family protein [Clostridia bacterium]|nr:GtrA family protein [Clostridia bacterium]
MEKIRSLFVKYKEIILYIFFGGLTTLVNWGSYFVLSRTLTFLPDGVGVTVATAIAQVLSILFAYVTNRKWVFESRARGFKQVFTEMVKFFGARLASAVLDVILMFVFVNMIGVNDNIMKLISNVIIIAVNYVASKLFIFKKQA